MYHLGLITAYSPSRYGRRKRTARGIGPGARGVGAGAPSPPVLGGVVGVEGQHVGRDVALHRLGCRLEVLRGARERERVGRREVGRRGSERKKGGNKRSRSPFYDLIRPTRLVPPAGRCTHPRDAPSSPAWPLRGWAEVEIR